MIMVMSFSVCGSEWTTEKELDCFGDLTGQEYKTNSDAIYGSYDFNKKLSVKIKINSKNEVLIELYERYVNLVAGNYINPVIYKIKIKDIDGNVYELKGLGYSNGIIVTDNLLFKSLSEGDCKVYMESQYGSYLFKIEGFEVE